MFPLDTDIETVELRADKVVEPDCVVVMFAMG